MANHLFAYFRIAEHDTATALPRWQHWLDTVEEATGVTGALMRRLGTRDGQAIWMESYDDIPPALATMLTAPWETGGSHGFVAGEHRVELFVDLENS